MKIEEFKNEIDSIGFYNDRNLQVTEDDYSFYIKDDSRIIATVSKSTTYLIDTNYVGFMGLTEALRRDLLDAMYKFTSTPPDEREDEKKYYLRHRFLEDGAFGYLNQYIGDEVFALNTNVQSGDTKTQFTQEEIDEIKEECDTDLKDFEIIEVEE